MRKLLGALAFSSLLLAQAACPRRAEPSPDRVEPGAAARASAPAPGSQDGAGGQDGGADAAGTTQGEARLEGADAGTQADAPAGGREACLDRWLAGKGLDRYGNPAGTMYAGGTPLFDERTGERHERVGYVLGRHPEARAACGPADAGP